MIEKIKTWVEKYDDISSWRAWENTKIKSSTFGSFQFWSALIFTLIFYHPFMTTSTSKNAFLNYGDNITLWIPQLINSQFFNREFIFKGIDFFTHGGASEYFLRPNILTYNPIILLSSFILYAKNLYAVLRLYFVLFVVHSFLACLFTQKLCVRFLNFDKYLALFTAICFSFSLFFINNLGFAPFLFITCLMPVCIYLLLSCAEEFDLRNTLLATLTIITLYTSGYIILSVFVMGVSLIFCLICLYLHHKFTIRNISKILVPFLTASTIVLPLYVAILDFHHVVMPSVKSLATAAHTLGTNPKIALRLLSNSLRFPGGGEQNSITLGLIPISILLLFIFSDTSNQHKMKNQDAKMAVFGFVLFTLVFYACLGVHSPFSYFMYLIPVIGKTHLYTRYLLPLSLLLFITVAILLDFIIKHKDNFVLKIYLFLIILLFFSLSSLIYLEHPMKELTSGNFFFELMLLIPFISCLILIRNYQKVIFISTILVFSSSLMIFYQLSFERVHKNEIMFEMAQKNYDNENKFINYLKNYSNREIVKIADITPGFYGNYMMKNMPWLLRGKVNISSYYGYELHLARDVKYDQVAHVSVEDNNSIFIQNIEWLKKTGAEFVIFQSGFKKHNEVLLGLIDHKTILELPHGTFVAKLKIRDPKNTIVNNGYIRVLSEDKKANIANFYTNNANYFSFEADSMTPLTAQYLFWPNKRMKPYINGKRYAFNRIDDLDVISIPAGKNKVEIIYENNALNIFLTLYFSFLAVFSLYILQQIVLFGARIKKDWL